MLIFVTTVLTEKRSCAECLCPGNVRECVASKLAGRHERTVCWTASTNLVDRVVMYVRLLATCNAYCLIKLTEAGREACRHNYIGSI